MIQKNCLRSGWPTFMAHPDSSRALGKDAGPFIVHGHRLSSLYRGLNRAPIPFIVLKILKENASWLAERLSICGTMKTGAA